jgi:pilus assembly protein CpaE
VTKPEDSKVPVFGANNETRRGALKVHLVGGEPEQRAAVKTALAVLTDPPLDISESDPHSGVNALGAAPDVTMVLFNGNEDTALSYLQKQAVQTPRPLIFALLAGRSPGLMKRVLRAGADELLFLPLDPGDATRALLKINETRWRAQRHGGGVICSITSIVGGVGVTTIAANLALALHKVFKKRVALVDLDLQTGGLSVLLSLEPEVTILPLIRLERKLDSLQLESALTKHPSGLYVLAAPKRIEEGDLVSDLTVAAVLDLMRELFDFVIVDCGDHVDENAVAAWERTEHLFYVLEQSIVAARCAWRFIDLFERLGLSALAPKFILNRHRPLHPIGEKQIESTLGRPIFAHLPDEERVLERVELTGQDLWQVAPHSPLARAMEDLALRVTPGGEVEAQENGGIIGRLKSVFTRRGATGHPTVPARSDQ